MTTAPATPEPTYLTPVPLRFALEDEFMISEQREEVSMPFRPPIVRPDGRGHQLPHTSK
jgi:hypothetical protein